MIDMILLISYIDITKMTLEELKKGLVIVEPRVSGHSTEDFFHLSNMLYTFEQLSILCNGR